jgi:hypothetical protein
MDKAIKGLFSPTFGKKRRGGMDKFEHTRICKNGGERGIRTLEGFYTLHAFQACAIDHSATSPQDGGNPSSLTQSPTPLLPLLPSRPGGVHNMSPSGDQDGSPLGDGMLKEKAINSYRPQ